MSTPLTNKQQCWSTQLQNAEAFDGSVAEYARSQGVSTQTLYRWRHCLRQRDVSQASTKKRYLPISEGLLVLLEKWKEI
jgi:transposase-like protein